MHTTRNREKKLAWLTFVLIEVLLLLPIQTLALDSSTNAPIAVNSQSTGGASSCSYYFTDSYDGTVLPGYPSSNAAPTGTAITLKFYNNVYNNSTQTTTSTPTTQSTVIPCNGTFQIVFTIELQANTNVASVVVTPVIQDTLGTTLYPPPTGGSTTTTFYPQCNNSSYSSTPYCTVGWVTGSVQVQLPINDKVLAPTLTVNSSVTVIGGQFEIFYLHP